MFPNKKSYSLSKFPHKKSSNSERYSTRSDNDINISNEMINQQNIPITLKPVIGILYMFLYSIFYQFASVIIKRLHYINPSQLALIRNFSVFAAILPVTVYQKKQILIERNNRLLLLLRSFLGATALYFAIMAYSYLPLAEASIIMSISPIVTALFARILLKESYGLVQSLTFVMSVCGVLLSLRIPKLILNRNEVFVDSTYVAGLAAAIGTVSLEALTVVLTRKLKTVHISIMLLYFGFIDSVQNALLNGIFIPFVKPECGLDEILCILLGLLALISNCFVTMSCQVQPAGLAALQKSSLDILIIIVFQIIFFNIYPDEYVICGACIIIASLIVLGIRNWTLIT